MLEASGTLLGLSWAIVEAIDQKRGELQLALPLGSPKNGLLKRSWGALGPLLGALGAVLGLSWASPEALLGHLGAILRPRKAIGSEKTKRQKHLVP